MRHFAIAWLLTLVFAGHAQAGLRHGQTPPDSLGMDRNGQGLTLKAQHGKVVVVTFWATWCGYCLKELPILENLQRRLGKERIEVVAINTDKDRGKYVAMRRKLKDFELTMTADEDDDLAKAYGVTGLPHLVLIDKEGKIAFVHVGYAEKALPGFVDEINTLLEE